MKKIENQKKLGNKGFSLVELIVVIAIMAVLVAVLAPTLIGNIEKSREGKDFSTLGTVYTAIQTAYGDEAGNKAAGTTLTATKIDTILGAGSVSTGNEFQKQVYEILGKKSNIKLDSDAAGKSSGEIYVSITNGNIRVWAGTSTSTNNSVKTKDTNGNVKPFEVE